MLSVKASHSARAPVSLLRLSTHSPAVISESTMKRYHIFISHSWTYGSRYNGLISLLKKDPDFDFRNYSVPKDDPIHNAKNDTQLRRAIKKQMQPCSAVLIMTGMYAHYSKWIKQEIHLAKHAFSLSKPIIAVKHRGSKRTSRVVKDAADKVVKWNSKSITKAIKEVVR